MRQIKRTLLVILVAALLLGGIPVAAFADSVTGRMESHAINLKPGKAKNAKFQGSTESVYFWVSLNTAGRLKISFSAKDLGSDVAVTLYRQGEYMWKQSKTLKYKKSKKLVSGTLTSEYILPSGGYFIMVTPETSVDAGKKFKLTAKFTEEKLDDIEPNNNEETAQPMTVEKSGGKAVTYKMLLSNLQGLGQEDIIDCFSFKLKKAKKLRIRLVQKEKKAAMKVLIRKKTSEGYETVNMYDVSNGKLDKKISLKKGTYCLKVWYDGADAQNMLQVPYTVSAAAVEPVAKVALNKRNVTLWTDKSGGKTSVQLRATVSPKNADNKKVKWTTSNKKVAKVSASGKVTAVGAGKATIRATAQDGSKKYAVCKVTVIAPVTEVTLDKSAVTLWTDSTKGQTSVQLNAKVSPKNAGNKKLKWTSSNQNVAKVSDTGKVTAVAAGTATIRAEAQDGSGKYAVCKVTVKRPQPNRPEDPNPPQVAPVISGGTSVNVGSTITFRVTNVVGGGTWYSTNTAVLAGSGSGSSCTMRGVRAGTASVYYVANGVRSNTITVRVRGL